MVPKSKYVLCMYIVGGSDVLYCSVLISLITALYMSHTEQLWKLIEYSYVKSLFVEFHMKTL